jgi:hypothetical protein
MDWPPKVGELLPRAEEAIGIRSKLSRYVLNISHETGGAKAEGFAQILGITIREIDRLEAEIRTGIAVRPVDAVRYNRVGRPNCVVEFPIRGIGRHKERMVTLRTIWEIPAAGRPPRLVSALLKP